MYIIYFTSTGNSLYVARKIAESMESDNEIHIISLVQALEKKESDFSDDIIGIISPVYAFGLPDITRRFIRNVCLRAEYSFIILTYGNAKFDAEKHAAWYSRHHGIDFDYVNSILMVDNYLPFFDSDKQSKKQKNIEKCLDEIITDIKESAYKKAEAGLPSIILGTFLRSFAFIFSRGNKAAFLRVSGSCIRCGVCKGVCPRGNITITDEKAEMGKSCEFCLGCAHVCPKKAITVAPFEMNRKARFRNSHVSVQDIIDSNDISN